ncbi:hypothetical protein ACVWWJ_002659 [Luteibacter sp. HA06]
MARRNESVESGADSFAPPGTRLAEPLRATLITLAAIAVVVAVAFLLSKVWPA